MSSKQHIILIAPELNAKKPSLHKTKHPSHGIADAPPLERLQVLQEELGHQRHSFSNRLGEGQAACLRHVEFGAFFEAFGSFGA